MGSMNQQTGAMGPPPRPSATDSAQSIHQGRRNKPAYHGTPGDARNTAGQSGVYSQSGTYSQQSNYDPPLRQTPPRRNTTGYYNTPGNTPGTASSAESYSSSSSYSPQGSQGYRSQQGRGGIQGYHYSGPAYPSAAYSNIREPLASPTTSTPSLASQSSQTYGGHSLAQPVPGLSESPQQGRTAQGMSSTRGGTAKLAPLPSPRPEWSEEDIRTLKCNSAIGNKWRDIKKDYPDQTADYYSCLRWTAAEDNHIRAIPPGSDWNLVLPNLRPGRTVEEVKQRHLHLMALDSGQAKRPDVRGQQGSAAQWSLEEDRILRVTYARGCSFDDIGKALPERTKSSLWNYRHANVPRWSKAEDDRLLQQATQQSWEEIATLPDFKGRIAKELEARWHYLVTED